MCAANTTHPTREQLADFVAGKLGSDQRTQVELHVADCADCCDLLRSLPAETLLRGIRLADTSFEPGETSEAPVAERRRDEPPASEATTGLPPELVDHPRYRIIRQLGAGGMGVVYEAEHRLMHRPVALKVIRRQLVTNQEAIERFHLEVKAAAMLSHRNIVTAHDAEQAGDAHFLVMEFVAGVSLNQLVQHRGPVSVLHACNFVMQAAQGLQHAAEQGMVHRDIKPQNLMRTPKGIIKILDFGLARLASELDSARLTRAGSALGTVDYMAPEQVEDSRHVDIRADIYSLGCTLYYLLAGHVPFPTGTLVDKVYAHRDETPRPLTEIRSDIPPEVVRIVQRMMAKDPAQRFQMPADVVAALKPLARPASATSPGTEPVTPPPPPSPPPAAPSGTDPGDVTLDMTDPLNLDLAELPSVPSPAPASRPFPQRPSKRTTRWVRVALPSGIAVLMLLAGWGLWRQLPALLVGFSQDSTAGQGEGDSLPQQEPLPRQPTDGPIPRQSLPAGTNPDGWIDLPPRLDAARYVGQWRLSGNALQVDDSTSGQLMLPYSVPAEYDFEVSFTRHSGSDSIALFFVAGSGQATYEVDAWYQHLAGIQSIGGERLDGDAPAEHYKLENGRRYTARVEVRRQRVVAYLDDQPIATYTGDGSDLTIVDAWPLRDPQVLGIGAYKSTTTFHRIRLRPVR